MKPGAPWSVKGIDPKAREVAKSLAHARGQSLGEWMTKMILDAESGAPEGTDAAAPAGGPQKAIAPPARAAGAATEPQGAQVASRPADPASEADGAGGPQDARIVDALVSLSRRLEQIEQRVTVGTQSLSRDVAVLREGLQNLGREFVATRRHTVAQQEAILKRTEQAIAAAGAANTGVTALQNRLQALPGPSAAAADQPRSGQEGLTPGRQPEPSSATGPTGRPSPIGEPAREMPPPSSQGGPSGAPQAGPEISSHASSQASSQPAPRPASPSAASQPHRPPAPERPAPTPPAPDRQPQVQPAPAQTAPPQPAPPPQQQAPQKQMPAGPAPESGASGGGASGQTEAAPAQPSRAEPPTAGPAKSQTATPRADGAPPTAPAAAPRPQEPGPQKAALRESGADDDDEDVEYEIVEYELQEGEDPADYAGSDEYEVVVEDRAAQAATAEPSAAPPQERPSSGGLALRATGSAAAPLPPLRAVDLGPGEAQNGGMRGQGGRRLRLPLGAQDTGAPEAGADDAGAAPARPGGLPRLSGGERPAITETKASRSDGVDPLLAAVDRRVSGARTSPEAGARAGIFGMTWRKGLGQPPRPAAEAAAGADSPEEPQADWENPGWGGAGGPPGAAQSIPEEAQPAKAAAGSAAEDAEPTEPGAAAGGRPRPGPAAIVRTAPPAAAGEADSAQTGGSRQSPSTLPDATASAGPAKETQPAGGCPTRAGAAPAARGPDGEFGPDGKFGPDGEFGPDGALGPDGAPGGGSGPAAMAAADGPAAGLRRGSRRPRRERHGGIAGGLPPAAEEGWPDFAAAEMAPRRSRRRPLLLAAIGVLLVAGAAVVLALLNNSTAPDGIDYVTLDQERRAQQGQTDGTPARPGPADAAPDSSAPAALPAATADAPRDSPRALGDVPRADDGPRNGAEAAAAIAELRQASDGGSAQAAYELGLRLHDGIGVRRDPDAAAIQFQRAADLGYAPAQLALGVAYEQGQGVPRDLEQAAYWYAVAADQGNADAQFNFGTLYARGEGVDQDYYQAAKWYRRAADAGLADAQFNYANMLESGLGVQQDRQQAYRYYRMAAEAGDPVAAERERALAATLGPDVVARLNAAGTAMQDSGAGRAETAPEPDAPGRMTAGDTAAPAEAMASGAGDTGQPAPETGQTGQTSQTSQTSMADAADQGAERGAEQMSPLSGRQEVAELQDLLNRLGFDAGPADGVIGSRTRTAITAFQQAAGLPADGVPSRGLLMELRQLAQTSR